MTTSTFGFWLSPGVTALPFWVRKNTIPAQRSSSVHRDFHYCSSFISWTFLRTDQISLKVCNWTNMKCHCGLWFCEVLAKCKRMVTLYGDCMIQSDIGSKYCGWHISPSVCMCSCCVGCVSGAENKRWATSPPASRALGGGPHQPQTSPWPWGWCQPFVYFESRILGEASIRKKW